jgi:hypothetical protein
VAFEERMAPGGRTVAGVVRFGQCPEHEMLMSGDFPDTNALSSAGNRRRERLSFPSLFWSMDATRRQKRGAAVWCF